MAKKPHDFRDMSTIVCAHPGCTRKIKKNVVARKAPKTRLLCKYHYWVGHGHLSHRAGKLPAQPV
jgi:hypothetical protein